MSDTVKPPDPDLIAVLVRQIIAMTDVDLLRDMLRDLHERYHKRLILSPATLHHFCVALLANTTLDLSEGEMLPMIGAFGAMVAELRHMSLHMAVAEKAGATVQ